MTTLVSDPNPRLKTNPITMLSKEDIRLTDFESYKYAVEKMAASRSNEEFTNAGPIHAAIVFGNMFKTATKKVNIYAGDFCGTISDQDYYLKYLKTLLDRNIKLSIIFQKQPEKNSKALKEILRSSNTNYSIRVLNKDQDVFKHHFTTADSRMYRIELANTYEAECCFNNSLAAEKLDNVFSHLETISTPYSHQ